MEMIELSKIVSDEKKVIQYLQQKAILKKFDSCPYCGSIHIGSVRRNKLKCYSCRKEWSIRKDSILENLKIPPNKFLLAIKLFELEISALQASKQLKVSYKTMLKLYDFIRRAIYCEVEGKGECLEGEVEMDESYFVSIGFRHERIDYSKRFANGKVYINGIEGFWSYAKERLMRYHGVSREKFVLYLKELEYRYNIRGSEIFSKLIGVLAKHGKVAKIT